MSGPITKTRQPGLRKGRELHVMPQREVGQAESTALWPAQEDVAGQQETAPGGCRSPQVTPKLRLLLDMWGFCFDPRFSSSL